MKTSNIALVISCLIPVSVVVSTHIANQSTEYYPSENTRVIVQPGTAHALYGGGHFTIPTLPYRPVRQAIVSTEPVVRSDSQPERRMAAGESSAHAVAATAYSLDQTARTSAGVYDGNRLVRTLWSNRQQPPGTYPLDQVWDGTDDEQQAVAADKEYTIKVLTSNVTYQWLAPLGNTSVDSTGSGVHHSFQLYNNMVQVGQQMYCANGYNESGDTHHKFTIGKPNRLTTTLKSGCMVARFIASDGDRVYYAGQARDGVSFTTAIVPKPAGTDSLYRFSTGRSIPVTGNNTYQYSGIDYEPNNNEPTGLAVQTKGDFLFIAHGPLNQLRVLNKYTGGLLRTLTIPRPGEIKVNGSTLWLITNGQVARYTINTDGTLSGPTLTLTGITEPLAMGLSADGATVAVCDRGDSHQVKFYETVSGRLLRTLGRAESYANPAVYDDKFYFNNTRLFSEDDYGAAHAFVSFQSDGSVWVGDYGNMRCQHFSATGAYIDNIQYMGYSYSCQVDATNPTRVFSDFLEFNIDYTTNKWRFVRNWSKNITRPTVYDENRMRSVVTLSNGRTYCLYTETPATAKEVLELTLDNGVRHTGLHLDNLNSELNADGSQWQIGGNQLGKPTFWQRRALTGFDSTGNPQWGSAVVVEQLPTVTLADPLTADGYLRRQQYTSNGLVIGFNADNGKGDRGRGYHLGGVKGGQWLFRVSPSTRPDYRGDFPDDGAFDIGNEVNVPATFMQVVDNFIFWGYKGEFWKSTQTNKYQHYLDNGLMAGQFGTTGEVAKYDGESPAQMAGNANSGTYVKVGNDIHFFHCDEGQHAGVHHWKISNLNSIRLQTFAVAKPVPITHLTESNCVNLMDGIPVSGTMVSGTGRWQYTPGSYYNGPYDQWSVLAGLSTYRRDERSIRLVSYPVANGQQQQAICDLTARPGVINQFNSWTITGSVTYPELSEPDYNYLEVTDLAGKIICRLSRPEVYPNASIMVNGTTLVSGPLNGLMSNLFGHAQKLSISRSGNGVQVQYGSYPAVTVAVLEKEADISRPSQLRVRLYSSGTRAHQLDLGTLTLCHNPAEQDSNTCTTVKDGVWTDPSVWQCNRVPLPTDVVYLKHNLTVPPNYTAYVDRIIYATSAKLTYDKGAYIILNKK